MQNIYIVPLYFMLQPFFEIINSLTFDSPRGYQLLGFFHLLFSPYDYDMHVEGLLPD